MKLLQLTYPVSSSSYETTEILEKLELLGERVYKAEQQSHALSQKEWGPSQFSSAIDRKKGGRWHFVISRGIQKLLAEVPKKETIIFFDFRISERPVIINQFKTPITCCQKLHAYFILVFERSSTEMLNMLTSHKKILCKIRN